MNFQKFQFPVIRGSFLTIRVYKNNHSCSVDPRRLLMQPPDFVGEPLRFEHLEPRASREQFPLEVGRGSEEKLEVGKILFVNGLNFLLRVVQGQVSEVITFFAVGSEHDVHRLAAIADDHAVALAEELVCIKVFVHLESLVGGCQVFHAVEGEHGEAAVIETAEILLARLMVFTSQMYCLKRVGMVIIINALLVMFFVFNQP